MSQLPREIFVRHGFSYSSSRLVGGEITMETPFHVLFLICADIEAESRVPCHRFTSLAIIRRRTAYISIRGFVCDVSNTTAIEIVGLKREYRYCFINADTWESVNKCRKWGSRVTRTETCSNNNDDNNASIMRQRRV